MENVARIASNIFELEIKKIYNDGFSLKSTIPLFLEGEKEIQWHKQIFDNDLVVDYRNFNIKLSEDDYEVRFLIQLV